MNPVFCLIYFVCFYSILFVWMAFLLISIFDDYERLRAQHRKIDTMMARALALLQNYHDEPRRGE